MKMQLWLISFTTVKKDQVSAKTNLIRFTNFRGTWKENKIFEIIDHYLLIKKCMHSLIILLLWQACKVWLQINWKKFWTGIPKTNWIWQFKMLVILFKTPMYFLTLMYFSSDDKFDEFIQELPQMKALYNEKEMLLASNKSLAEYNLSQAAMETIFLWLTCFWLVTTIHMKCVK